MINPLNHLLKVGYFKPFETGVVDFPLDGTKMLNLTKQLNPSFDVTINDVVPYQFKLPAAPYVAKGNTIVDMDFLKGAKRLMEAENAAARPPQPKKTTTQQTGGNIDMKSIAVLIENTVRKVMDEKLNQILSASQTQSINENLVLKVGDSIFKGKITGVNKSK
jgi:hypothetical protein